MNPVVVRNVAVAALGLSMLGLAFGKSFASPAVAAAPVGKSLYAAKCAACHGTVGQGAERAGPPLAHNWYVTGDAKKVIRAVADGMAGPITFNGKSWGTGMMPAWKNSLNKAQIAAVVTFIRTSWGNKASPVTEQQVAADE